MSMTKHLRLLREGQTSFEQFARATSRDWRLLAHYLLKRWRVPAAVEVEDVEQEMLLEAWRAVADWSPDGGAPIAKYVVFRSCSQAKAWLHKQRGALKRRDNSPSRHPIAMADVGSGEDLTASVIDEGPSQEDAVEAMDALCGTLARCATTRDWHGVEAVARGGGSIENAVDILWADADVRRRCRLGSKLDARRAIWTTMTRLSA